MDDRRAVIIRTFARWVAASATRQGSPVGGRALYEHIDRVHIEPLLAEKSPSIETFAKWHRREVERLSRNAKVPIGWAAKIVNMLTKVHAYLAGRGSPALLRLIHPLIDNLLVNTILKTYSARTEAECKNRSEILRLCSMGKPIKSVTSYERYLEVVAGLKLIAQSKGWTLFEIESLWDKPSVRCSLFHKA